MMNVIPYRACYINKKEMTMLFFSSAFNGIFQMDLKNGEVQNIGSVPDENMFQDSLYGEMVIYKEWIVLIPLTAREIAVLERESGRCIKKIKLPEMKEVLWKFASGIVYGDEIILVPFCYPCFLSVSMIDFSVAILQDWTKYLEMKCGIKGRRQLAALTFGLQKSHIYIQVIDTNYLLKFDMQNKKIACIISLPKGVYTYAICDGESVYIVPEKCGEILRMDVKSEKIESFCQIPVTILPNRKGHVSIHGRIIRKKLILFPQMASHIGIIDLESGETNSCSGEWSSERQSSSQNIFQKIAVIDERYAVVLVCYENNKNYGCFLIDTFDFSCRHLGMNMRQSIQTYIETCMKKSAEQNEIINEYKLYLPETEDILGSFVNVCGRQDVKKTFKENQVGTKIFHLLGRD